MAWMNSLNSGGLYQPGQNPILYMQILQAAAQGGRNQAQQDPNTLQQQIQQAKQL
jgi:hypothetical protein